MINKNIKIYIAGHRGMVGSAVWRALKSKGYSKDFTTLEDGVKSYLDWLSKQA